MDRKFTVTLQEKGSTLLAFLRANYPDAPSVKALKRSIEAKQCTINGRVETFSTHPLAAGDVISLELGPPALPCKPVVVWEDEALIAFDKPAGIVSDSQYFKGHLIHRLDKDTSGVILVAKSKSVREQMVELFRKKQVQKTYLAVVDGCIKQKSGTIVSRLAPKHCFQGQTVYASSPKGKHAQTRWVRVGQSSISSLLECYPITGRTHQIRVHLQELGHPIVGDYHYTKQFSCGYRAQRHLLHALAISFSHPLSNKYIKIEAPLPADFSRAIQALQIVSL